MPAASESRDRESGAVGQTSQLFWQRRTVMLRPRKASVLGIASFGLLAWVCVAPTRAQRLVFDSTQDWLTRSTNSAGNLSYNGHNNTETIDISQNAVLRAFQAGGSIFSPYDGHVRMKVQTANPFDDAPYGRVAARFTWRTSGNQSINWAKLPSNRTGGMTGNNPNDESYFASKIGDEFQMAAHASSSGIFSGEAKAIAAMRDAPVLSITGGQTVPTMTNLSALDVDPQRPFTQIYPGQYQVTMNVPAVTVSRPLINFNSAELPTWGDFASPFMDTAQLRGSYSLTLVNNVPVELFSAPFEGEQRAWSPFDATVNRTLWQLQEDHVLSFTAADIGKMFDFDFSASTRFRAFNADGNPVPTPYGEQLGAINYRLEVIPEPSSLLTALAPMLIVARRRRERREHSVPQASRRAAAAAPRLAAAGLVGLSICTSASAGLFDRGQPKMVSQGEPILATANHAAGNITTKFENFLPLASAQTILAKDLGTPKITPNSVEHKYHDPGAPQNDFDADGARGDARYNFTIGKLDGGKTIVTTVATESSVTEGRVARKKTVVPDYKDPFVFSNTSNLAAAYFIPEGLRVSTGLLVGTAFPTDFSQSPDDDGAVASETFMRHRGRVLAGAVGEPNAFWDSQQLDLFDLTLHPDGQGGVVCGEEDLRFPLRSNSQFIVSHLDGFGNTLDPDNQVAMQGIRSRIVQSFHNGALITNLDEIFSVKFVPVGGVSEFTYGYRQTDQLSQVSVPEPSAVAGAMGLATAGLTRRRTRPRPARH
jgi:hypothetical protein